MGLRDIPEQHSADRSDQGRLSVFNKGLGMLSTPLLVREGQRSRRCVFLAWILGRYEYLGALGAPSRGPRLEIEYSGPQTGVQTETEYMAQMPPFKT